MRFNFSALLKYVDVRPVQGSMVIHVNVESRDAKKAALIANTVADIYIKDRLADKAGSAIKLTKWLEERILELRAQMRGTQQRAEYYRADNNLAEGVDSLLSAEQLSQLNEQLILAQTLEAGAKARVQQLQGLMSNHDLVDNMPEGLNTDFIRTLRLDAIRLEREISELSGRYGPKHPQMIKRWTELESLRATLHPVSPRPCVRCG